MKRLLNLVKLTLVSLSIPSALAAPSHADQIQARDPLIIDTFRDSNTNDVGGWHGADKGLFMEHGPGYLRLVPENAVMGYHTQVSQGCRDLTPYKDMFLHLSFAGTDKFTISLSENNPECSRRQAPFPATWDSVEASRYVYPGGGRHDIYVPISHFNINLGLASSIDVHGFYTKEQLQLFKVEITPTVPADWRVPDKRPTGMLVQACTRKDSFAFGIDDGNPRLAQQIMKILAEERVLATFFVVGNGLVDQTTNFTEVYKEMLRRGHQIAMHSYSHPVMEGLETIKEVDYQFSENIKALKDRVGVETRYFRPPYGNVGARTRQQLASKVQDPYIVNWSVDVEDWLWAKSKTPERQLRSFERDLKKGGNLAVTHFSHESTVKYFKDFIKMVKKTGKKVMRVDQCLEDPAAPPLK